MRPEELASYLVTIRNAVADDFRPDLTSDHVKAEAGAIVMLLNRIITTLKTGDHIAASRFEAWGRIRSDLKGLGIELDTPPTLAAQGSMGSLQALDARLRDIQAAIGRDTAFTRLTGQLAAHEARTEDWYSRTVAALVDLAEAGEPQVRAGQPKQAPVAPADDSERLRAALAGYLQRRYPSLPRNSIARLRIAPGGHCKQTAIFSLVANNVLPINLVLRRDLAQSITGASVVDEYPTIQRAFEIGLPVPKPILVEADQAVLGGQFMIMTEVTDALPAGTYFPEERRYGPRTVGPDFGKEVAGVLARLHSATRVKVSGPSAEQSTLVKKSFESWRALPAQPFSLATELAYAWLMSHPLPADRPRCLIHGDVGTHNILVRDGHLAALLDWELAHEADPAEDLAQCRMMLLPDVMPWEKFVQEYVAAGGDAVACEANSVAYYCVWTYLKHGLMNGTLRALYLQGERDDVIAASVAGHYYHRLMQYQARALQIAVDASRAG